PLKLDDVMSDLAPLLKRTVGERIELKVSTGRDLWHVRTDKLQLDQAILNLAVNARDAMGDAGGKLTVRTRNVTERETQRLQSRGMQVGEYVLIEVEDTGSGIAPEMLEQIFEPFFTTKAPGKGTGLGLATVYGIVKQTGGFIYPESEVGKGTTFKIFLPRYRLAANEQAELDEQRTANEKRATIDMTGNGRVLLVEDEEAVRSFAVRALTRQGYEVLEAGDGVEALDVVAREGGAVDIVVSDVVMPEMDGPTMLKELRKTNPDLKIIFVSGYPNEAFQQALGEETFAFLPKPFSLPQLAAKVKEQLAQ
ncbi:MAG: response regulator, partial [Pseudomonadota bacterium]